MKIFTLAVVIFIFLNSFGQTREHAFEINKKLGRGINYGNMFEAPTETSWENPWQPEYASMIAELGFNHVRIPIRWEPEARSSLTSPYTIETSFLNRIKQVVDSALNNDLFVIINMHHHDSLYAYPDAQKERFLAQWKQISDFLKDYSDSLLFEILNEPHGNLTTDKWNSLSGEALQTIRMDNPDRIVLIGTAEYGGLFGLPELQLPDDENIIVTVHYYNPFSFTHQGASWAGDDADSWLGTEWTDTKDERDVMRQEFSSLVTFSLENSIPVHIGEFGAYSEADMTSRAKWTTFLARYFEQQNWSWAYWEFSAGFGIYNPNAETYYEDLVNALLHNKMPEPASYKGTTVYTSDFENSTDNWNLYTQGTGDAELSNGNNSLEITISNGSTESWHVQLVRGNISLEKGKKYRLSFRAKADANRSFSPYVGQSISQWSSYSGYNAYTANDSLQTFTVIFDMTENDDRARIVFDLGKSDINFSVTGILLEEIELVTNLSEKKTTPEGIEIYPNPVTENLIVKNNGDYKQILIFNISGELILQKELQQNENIFNLANIKPGMYFVQLRKNSEVFSTKIIKQ
ncbi:cellulase family glycosylhydrolase [Maribellus maritimus]|uniref:cellulase family glycosylhydrolase n=1 Tax=Maribellus maritimus TaxID=2870838 RepID=UPI001EEB6800|nr:cellulase family glycosylhydrolase [Maribellus maritimus]MCG6189427.1 cellulase family glycosylhydrolase [Maribellus maritimus]